ncbi:hypothetical protein AXF42_Ash008321 [Apostasia shenzhenica]|uniref:DUF4216 domain-containing protein n=1 Tax=Apostasia shenzhenica TaxID=1088818 RepID=A0A2I0AXI8_9ASPA|nr:hypothetical protein AXF42_Ash008321 [Apostasia shenzhenica]
MKILKGYVRNRYRPKTCIIESYVTEEIMEYCTEYLHDVNPIGIPIGHNLPDKFGKGLSTCKPQIVDLNLLNQAHLYVLHNTAIIDPYIEKHMEQLRIENPLHSRDEVWIQNKHIKEFIKWFKNHIFTLLQRPDGVMLDKSLKYLSFLPNRCVLQYDGYYISGYQFSTKNYDNKRAAQNSGVSLVAQTMQISSAKDKNPHTGDLCYYGVIEEIWEIDYNDFRLPIFKCTWIDSNGGSKIDENGFTLVNFNRIGHKDDCFILANKAKQVFYVQDPSNSQWSVVLTYNPRFFMEEHDNNITSQEMFVFTRSICKNVYDNFDDIPNYHIEDGGEIELDITGKRKNKKRKKLKN